MEISYTRELGNTYMVLEGEAPADSYETRLIGRHRLPGLMEIHHSSMDGKGAFYFNITGLCSLEKYYATKQISISELKNIIKQVGELPDFLESYLLDDSRIILSPQTIFVDGTGEKLYFAFLPGANEEYMASIRNLAIYFLKKIDHQEEACVSLAYELFELTAENNCDLRDIRNLVKTTSEDIYIEEDPAWDFNKPEEKEVSEDLWDQAPRPKAPENPQKIVNEKLLKIAGLAAPVLAVIIVGILLFL